MPAGLAAAGACPGGVGAKRRPWQLPARCAATRRVGCESGAISGCGEHGDACGGHSHAATAATAIAGAAGANAAPGARGCEAALERASRI
eukprot:355169-Chlamydomonas_euryale.AAC.2